MGQMTKTVDSLIAAIAAGLDLISCRRIVPIYHQSIYDGACIYSVSALFWVFAAALINGFFGLLMVLFRASYKPNRYIYPDLAEKDMGHEITYEESRPHQVNDFEADEVYSPQPNRRYDYEDEDETLTPQKPHANVY